jgi:hypothetical protein
MIRRAGSIVSVAWAAGPASAMHNTVAIMDE